MSKSQETKDVFGLYEEGINNVFATIHKDVPKFHQTITNLQQQYMQTCESTTKAVLAVQREYANKIGFNADVPDVATSAIKDVSTEISKSYSMQSQMIQTAMDSAQQNIKTLNENVKSFTEVQRNIIQSWIDIFTPSRN